MNVNSASKTGCRYQKLIFLRKTGEITVNRFYGHRKQVESIAFFLDPLRWVTDVWIRFDGSGAESVFDEARNLEVLTPGPFSICRLTYPH